MAQLTIDLGCGDYDIVRPLKDGAVRAEGLGTWSYNPTTQQYRMKLQFDRWAPDGTNVGYSTVERQLLMNTAGTQMAGPVYAVHYAADGSIIVQLCGHAVSTRQW